MHGQQPNDIFFYSLQQVKRDIAHLDVLSMIHDLLHFFHERNQPNFTLVVIKFYSGLRKVRYRERSLESRKCTRTPAKILVSVLLALVRFVGT